MTAPWPAPPDDVARYPLSPPTRSGRAAAAVGVVLGALWCLGLVVGGQGLGWVVDQVALLTGRPLPHHLWYLGLLATVAAVAAPAALLAFASRPAWSRAAGRAWLTAAALAVWCGLARLVPPSAHEAYLALLALLAGAGTVGVRLLRRRYAADRPGRPAPRALDAGRSRGVGRAATRRCAHLRGAGPSAGTVHDNAAAAGAHPGGAPTAGGAGRDGALLGAAAGLLALLPWLWAGALGGPLESALALLAAAAVGAAAAAVLDTAFWDAHRGVSPAGRTLRAAPVAGVALVVLGAGVGTPGPHLAVLAVLGALGVAVAALGTPGAAGWAVAAAAAGPLAFVDTEEVTLVLTGREVPFYAALATGAAVLLAWAGGAACLAAARCAPRRAAARRAVSAAVAVTLVAAGAVSYAALGQPGFHGDRLFVVLRDQAPLTGLPGAAPGLAGHAARVGAVHARLVAHATRAQADLRRTLTDWGVDHTPYYLMNAVEVHAGPALRPALARRADVARVLSSPRLRPLPAPPPTTTGRAARPPGVGWNVTMVGADAAWQRGATGRGVTVGTSDSGVDGAHPALAAGFRGGDDSWYDPWSDSRTPTDHGGHGTHTLGSAVGRLGIGVAPDARWVGCVNLDRNLANPARYLDCLQYMLAPFPPGGDPFRDGRPARAPHVLTNSWGCPEIEGCDAGALRPATAALAAAGIFVVAAAGNSGPGCGTITDPPAPYADVFTVGAVDRTGAVASFSSRGPTADGTPKPDVVAPGAAVLSAMPGGGYAVLDGTSMAAPHVAGVVALLWSAYPALAGDVAATAGILRRTAGVARTAGARCAGAEEPLVGAGLVNAPAALTAAAG